MSQKEATGGLIAIIPWQKNVFRSVDWKDEATGALHGAEAAAAALNRLKTEWQTDAEGRSGWQFNRLARGDKTKAEKTEKATDLRVQDRKRAITWQEVEDFHSSGLQGVASQWSSDVG